MRFSTHATAGLSALIAVSILVGTDAFTPQPKPFLKNKLSLISNHYDKTAPSTPLSTSPLFLSSANEEIIQPTDLTSRKGSASLLRTATLTDADGNIVKLDTQMTKGTSVVVFLRHMGWPYCWTYANNWCGVQPQLEEAGIAGPIFISIGDKDKLNLFLEKNPNVPRGSMFVDDYSFEAYNGVGFGSIADTDKEALKDVKMSAPDLGFGQWMSYFGSVMKLSPVENFGEVPEGVLRLGGTFVVNGNDVKYQWSDRIPGDHPNIPDVVEIAQSEVMNRKEENEKKFFGIF